VRPQRCACCVVINQSISLIFNMA